MGNPAGKGSRRTVAESLAHSNNAPVFGEFSRQGSFSCLGPVGLQSGPPRLDLFEVPYSGEFALDGPVVVALLNELAVSDPDAALSLVVAAGAGVPGKRPSGAQADQAFDALWKSFAESVWGGGNVPGNLHANVEALMRAIWRRHAKEGFDDLLSGARQSVRLGRDISLVAHKIGAGGEIRRGARIRVVVRNLPVKVVHQLPQPFLPGNGGRTAQFRVPASEMRRLASAADAIADARIRSTRVLRAAGTRLGGGLLAFGPSAALDLYGSVSYRNGSFDFDRKGFLIRSAKSQSGNALGFASGAAVASGAVALGLVSAVGWPVILIGLGTGIVAQTVWGATGMDEWAADRAANALR